MVESNKPEDAGNLLCWLIVTLIWIILQPFHIFLRLSFEITHDRFIKNVLNIYLLPFLFLLICFCFLFFASFSIRFLI